ncbi:MAG: chemotaxis protein CheX [Lachnospira sp.]
MDNILSKYIAKNHSGTVFTDKELNVLRQGDTDEMIETFFDMNNDYYITQMQCAVKGLKMLYGNLELVGIDYDSEYDGKFIGCQVMDGDIDVFLGVAGQDEDLLGVASAFCQEEISEFDSDAYDAICEFINIMNGAYATKLSSEEIQVTLHPPVFYMNTKVQGYRGFYIVSFALDEHRFKLLMAADDKINMIA